VETLDDLFAIGDMCNASGGEPRTVPCDMAWDVFEQNTGQTTKCMRIGSKLKRIGPRRVEPGLIELLNKHFK